ncbi:MAG: hypothetical protein EXR69_02295 [Myxococcales bacterium]|nr:hypothetical protein [Myxococcales bacterium]
MFRQILALVALPPSPGAPSAGTDLAVLAAVRELALPGRAGSKQAGGRVYLMHVREKSRGLFGGSVGSVGDVPPSLTEAARALAMEGIEVVTHFCEGRLSEQVDRVIREEQIDVVVVGRPKRGWGDHGLRIVRLADAPVLVMPEGTTLRRGTAVVGMDFSHNAVQAWMAASAFFAKVTAVAVIDPEGEQSDESTLRAQVQETWRSTVAAALAQAERATDTGGDIRVEACMQPADALLAAATDADLLAVGSRGLTPIAAVLLGSTAEKLGARFPNPLLVYRDPGTRRGLLQSFLGVG